MKGGVDGGNDGDIESGVEGSSANRRPLPSLAMLGFIA